MSPSAMPATQSESPCRQAPRLPRKVKVDVTKCRACHGQVVCVSKSCVNKSCVDRLCVGKSCVDKLCVSKLCVSKLCVGKLCVSKLCV